MQPYIYSPGSATTISSPIGFTKNSGTSAVYGDEWSVVTSSSYNATTYPAYYMFDSDTSTAWASKQGATTGGTNTEGHPYNNADVPAVLIVLPKKLFNITVKITNRKPPNTSAPVAGADYVYCYGYDSSLQSPSVSNIQTYAASDYGGATDEAWLKIDNRTNSNVSENILTCNFNNSRPYDIIGLACPAVCRTSNKYWAIGELSITGSDGYNGWMPATPYVRVDGTWKQAEPYIKVNDSWK